VTDDCSPARLRLPTYSSVACMGRRDRADLASCLQVCVPCCKTTFEQLYCSRIGYRRSSMRPPTSMALISNLQLEGSALLILCSERSLLQSQWQSGTDFFSASVFTDTNRLAERPCSGQFVMSSRCASAAIPAHEHRTGDPIHRRTEQQATAGEGMATPWPRRLGG
jgi:hypothetical protein